MRLKKIKGKNIVLRPITEADTPLILKWRNDPFVQKKFVWRQTLTAAQHDEWLHTKVFAGLVCQFIILVKDTDAPVGSVFLRDINHENKTAEFGIFIGESFGRGKGYGTEAARLILAHGFNELHLKNIFLRVFAKNAIAIRSYEKAGFVVSAPPPSFEMSITDEALVFMQASAQII